MDTANHNPARPVRDTASPSLSEFPSRASTMRAQSQTEDGNTSEPPDADLDIEKLSSHDLAINLQLAPTRSAALTTHSQKEDMGRPGSAAPFPKANRLTKTLSRLRTSDSIDPGPPPDGGQRAWVQACLTHLVIFNTWGFINSFGVFQTYYVDTLHLGSNSDVSWIGSVQVFILFGIGTFSGRATDAGFFRLTFAVGSVIYLGSMLALSWSRTYWHVFLAQGVGVGVGNGLVFVPTLALTSTYFLKNRGKALGIATSGSASGGLVFPAIAECLLPRIGYGWTIRVMTLVMGVTAATCMIGLKPRLPPRKTGPLVEWSAFRELPYTLYLIGAFFMFWGVYIGFFFVGSFGRNILGTSQSTSINLLLTMNGVGVFFRLIPNIISDRYTGPLNLMIPFTAIVSLMLFCWMGVTTVTGLWVFAVIYGMFAAGIQGLFPVVLTSLTTNPKKVGVRTGMGFGIVGFAVLTGPPIAGALISADGGSYAGMQGYAGACMLMAATVMVACRWSRCGWKVLAKM